MLKQVLRAVYAPDLQSWKTGYDRSSYGVANQCGSRLFSCRYTCSFNDGFSEAGRLFVSTSWQLSMVNTSTLACYRD
jgi:hypothetical protein